MEESPTFKRLASENRIEKAPALTVMRQHPREIILSALARMGEQAPFYIFTAFVFSYGVSTLKVSRDLLLVAVMAASVLSLITVPLSGTCRTASAGGACTCGAPRSLACMGSSTSPY